MSPAQITVCALLAAAVGCSALVLPAQERSDALANQQQLPSGQLQQLQQPADGAAAEASVTSGEINRGDTALPARFRPTPRTTPADSESLPESESTNQQSGGRPTDGGAGVPAPAAAAAAPPASPDSGTGADSPGSPDSRTGADSPGSADSPAAAPPASRQLSPMTQQIDQPSVVDSDAQAADAASAAAAATTAPELVTREPVPDNAYAVFDQHGHVCILATLMLDIEVVYFTRNGERKKVTIRLPEDADVTGACARDGALPKIVFSWDDITFSMLFNQNEFGNTWYVSDMKLDLAMEGDKFPNARNAGRQNLWMDVQKQHTLHLFASPVDKAYFCTSEQDLDLYDGDGVHAATLLLWNLHLQPYVKAGQFGPSVNCPGGKVGRRRINENVPLAVGSTLAAVTMLTIAGYAIWRHFKVKKFNYDTME